MSLCNRSLNFQPQDDGVYECKIRKATSSCQLTVKEKPAKIAEPICDATAEDGQPSVTMTCSLDRLVNLVICFMNCRISGPNAPLYDTAVSQMQSRETHFGVLKSVSSSQTTTEAQLIYLEILSRYTVQ